jgi:hypothetical protein
MARVVTVGSPEHVEGTRQMAAQLSEIRSLRDARRHFELETADKALTQTEGTTPDATRAHVRRRRVFALARRREMLRVLTPVEGAAAWSSLATMLKPAVVE